MDPLKGLFVLEKTAMDLVYGEEEQRKIAAQINPLSAPHTKESILEHPDLLAEADVIFSGWGAPLMDEAFLDSAKKLKVVFYGAGAIGSWTTAAFWERNIRVTTASVANAVPVAEYTLATILFSLKHGWRLAHQTRTERLYPARDNAPGCYGTTVGLVSLGVIARTLLKMLKPFDLKIIAYDPFLSPAEADELGIELRPLDQVFRQADVVSVHTPSLPETRGLITGKHLAAMKQGATFINTARGEVVDEQAMIDVLTRRTDLQAILDVLIKEPPDADSPFYTLPNVVLTPHIAGSVGQECRRMGQYMVDELERYLRGEPLKWEITREMAQHTAHRPVTVSVRRPAAVKQKTEKPALRVG